MSELDNEHDKVKMIKRWERQAMKPEQEGDTDQRKALRKIYGPVEGLKHEFVCGDESHVDAELEQRKLLQLIHKQRKAQEKSE
jgi:hypothetical protein